MLTRGLFLGPTDDDLREFKRLKRIQDRKSLVASWEEDWSKSGRTQDTDKAWKLLFYALREPIYSKSSLSRELGGQFETDWLLRLVCVGSEVFYGPNLYKANSSLLCHLDKRKLPTINAHLRNVDLKLFAKHCEKCDYFFKQHNFRFDTGTLSYLDKWLGRIREFLQRAEERGWHVLFSADNC